MALKRSGGTRRGPVKGSKVQPGQKYLQIGVPDRYTGFITGELSVEDLDDEEVMRGQLRSRNGDFVGRKPNAIPREFMVAIQIEQQKRFQDGLNPLVLDALNTLQYVMQPGYRAQPGDAAKVKAATYIIDRFAGKTPENVQLKAEVSTRFENIANEILIDVDDSDDVDTTTKEDDDELGEI